MSGQQIEGALVDLDGTVYLGGDLIPGARNAIQTLRERGVSVLFLSNNTTKRRGDYVEKLDKLGIPATIDDILNSASVTASYLADHHPTDAIFVVGEEPLREELRGAGLAVTDRPEEADVVLASMDREFDYDTLTASIRAIGPDTAFLATNPDRTCPTERGEIPDCGAITGAIEGGSGGTLDRVLGKPAQTTVDAATDAIGVDASRCLMIGDRLETDIRMGNRAGMTTVLTLTGVTDRATLERTDEQPDYVIVSLAEIGTVLAP